MAIKSLASDAEILVADIGGTKTSLCLANPLGGLHLHSLRTYFNQDAADFVTLYRRYLAEFSGNHQPRILSLSVAGPVHDQRCQLTNLAWFLDASALQVELSLSQVIMHNDLVTTAWGLLDLPEQDFRVLQPGAQNASASRLGVISLGTGLGQATVLQSSAAANTTLVIPSEGGHKDFGVYDHRSAALFQHALASKSNAHLCVEYFVSGMGLIRLYEFLASQQPASAPALLTNPDIVREGLTNPDASLAKTALLWLIEMLAREAANLALQNSCDAGIVICGGLAKRIQALLESPIFCEQFQARGAFSGWLRSLPVRLCINTEAPLWGCWALARRSLPTDG